MVPYLLRQYLCHQKEDPPVFTVESNRSLEYLKAHTINNKKNSSDTSKACIPEVFLIFAISESFKHSAFLKVVFCLHILE